MKLIETLTPAPRKFRVRCLAPGCAGPDIKRHQSREWAKKIGQSHADAQGHEVAIEEDV